MTSPHTWVFWVHGSTKARFEEAYRGIADRLELPRRYDPKINVLQLVRDWLCDEANGRWMVVLDNVDNLEVFYPQPDSGQDALAAFHSTPPENLNSLQKRFNRARDTKSPSDGAII
jgi:hypothetical protein